MTHRARTVGWDVSILMFFICVAGKKSQPFVASVRVAPHQEEAMLLGLDRVAGGRQARVGAFVLFRTLLWEDDARTVHTIHQGEG